MCFATVLGRSVVAAVFCAGSLAPAQEIRAAPGSLTFRHTIGKAVPEPARVLVETVTGAPASYTAAVSLTGSPRTNCLSIRSSGTTAPGLLEVRADATGLVPGEYRGDISLRSGGGASVTVPVLLTAIKPSIFADTDWLEFVYVAGGDPPGPKVIKLSCELPVSYRASIETIAGGDWLSVSPVEGSLPRMVQVTVNPAAVERGRRE